MMALDETSDSTLVGRVLSGQQDAFRDVVARYHATVRMVALAKTGNVADADDVAQETFLKAYQTLGVLRDHGKLAHWLVTIARNSAVSLVRKRERERRNAPELHGEPVVYPDPAYRERLEAVARQVEALPVNLREVVLLHYFEGLKCREIAERLDLSTAAVLKRLSRGRDLLGDRLLREWGEGARADHAGVQRVMGAVVALPQPDWGAQAAGMGVGGGTGGGGLISVWGVTASTRVVIEVGVLVMALVLSGYLWFRFPSENGAVELEGVGAETAVAMTAPAVDDDGAGDAPIEERDGRVVPVSPLDSDAASDVARPRFDVGFLSGQVVDQDGHPIQDARLSVRTYAVARVWGTASSNPNGEFRVNLTSDADKESRVWRSLEIELSCSKEGYGPAFQTVTMGSSDVRIVLLRNAVVEGTVVDAQSGRPIERFQWQVFRMMDNDTWPGVGMRSSTSAWRDVFSKTGSFTAEDSHGIDAISILSEGCAGARVDVDVPLGHTASGLVVALEAAQEIEGVVLDYATKLPLPGISVGIRSEAEVAFSRIRMKSRDDGTFFFRGVPTSMPVTITAGRLGYGSFKQTFAPDELSKPVEIYLGAGGEVSGFVHAAGKPPKAIEEGRYGTVNVRGAGEGASEFGFGEIQADGSYAVSGLSDGLYTVDAWTIQGDSRRQGSSLTHWIEIRNGKNVELDINCADEGGALELGVEGVGEDVLVDFTLELADVPGVVVWSQSSRDWARAFEGYSSVQTLRVAPSSYWLRAVATETGAVLYEERLDVVAGQTEQRVMALGAVGEVD